MLLDLPFGWEGGMAPDPISSHASPGSFTSTGRCRKAKPLAWCLCTAATYYVAPKLADAVWRRWWN